MHNSPNVSADLVWEVTRTNNAYLVKRRSGGGVQFSRDPFNLINKHSRKHAGFTNEKAVGVQPGERGGVTLITKTKKKSNKPRKQYHTVPFSKGTSNQSVYKGIANHVAKNGYRADLNREAVSRASAILYSQKPKKDLPAKKPRGAKAKAAEEKA